MVKKATKVVSYASTDGNEMYKQYGAVVWNTVMSSTFQKIFGTKFGEIPLFFLIDKTSIASILKLSFVFLRTRTFIVNRLQTPFRPLLTPFPQPTTFSTVCLCNEYKCGLNWMSNFAGVKAVTVKGVVKDAQRRCVNLKGHLLSNACITYLL